MSATATKAKPPIRRQSLANSAFTTILTGRMTRLGDSLTISAELIDAEHDRQMWGKQFKRKLADVNSLQADITRDITENLKLKLTGAQQNLMGPAVHAEPGSLSVVLAGHSIGIAERRGVNKAIDYFQQAIAKDPDYALAYSGLVGSYSPWHGTALRSRRRSWRESTPAAERALELDPTLGEAHAAMGLVLLVFNGISPERSGIAASD